MLFRQSRLILQHTFPMLIAQLASMGMMVIDTVLLGHHGTEDLAAVAVGGGIYIAVLFALCGILQAVAPMVSHLKGAGRDGEIAGALQQCFWLALLLAVPGILFLNHPDALLALSDIEAGVESKVRLYLIVLAWAIPAALFYRSFHAFCNALGQPRPLMLISFAGTLVHAVLAWALVSGWLTGKGLGVLGCAISNALVCWLDLLCAGIFMVRGRAFAAYRLLHGWRAPQLPVMRELVRLGLPMGFSNFIEISSFTLTALFVAQLGATVVAGHRIVANLAALCYMLPLALALATLTQVGQAAGARDWPRAKQSVLAGLTLAAVLALLLGALLYLSADALIAAYTSDPAVRHVALSLIIYIVIYQAFDAVQTVAAFALRGYKITFAPMFVHLLSFWGVALYGGWWLAFHAQPPQGVSGFWLASLFSLILAAVLLGGLLWRVVRLAR